MAILSPSGHLLSASILEKSSREIAPLLKGGQQGLRLPDCKVCQTPIGLFQQVIPFLLIANVTSIFQLASSLVW